MAVIITSNRKYNRFTANAQLPNDITCAAAGEQMAAIKKYCEHNTRLTEQ